MQASMDVCRRLIVLACGGLSAAAVALVAEPVITAYTGSLFTAWAFAASLLAITATVWRLGWHLEQTMSSDRDAATRSRADLQVSLDNMSQGLVLCNSSADVVAVNKRFLSLFDIPAHRILPGMSVPDLIRLQAETGNMPKAQADALVAERLNRPPGTSGQVVMAFQQGEFQIAYQPRPEGGWACTFEDVTAKRQVERQLAFLAHHDSLTGLPNRVLLRERIEAAISTAQPFALMLVDLDRFKQVNDTFGHATGDGLLCAVANRLRAAMRGGDTVARLGGDEFAIVMAAPCTREEADAQAGTLVRVLGDTFLIRGDLVTIGGSIGVTCSRAPCAAVSPDVDQILREADMALYCAKECGRGVHRFVELTIDRTSTLSPVCLSSTMPELQLM